MKDPFEAACEEQPESPPESPFPADDDAPPSTADGIDNDDEAEAMVRPSEPPPPPQQQQQQQQQHQQAAASGEAAAAGKGKEEDMDGEEEEENVTINVDTKAPSSADPDKMANMQEILSQFTEGQMSRYESFRRSGFQKSNMRRLLTSITGSQKISMPMTIVVSGIAKMFVGELVETDLIGSVQSIRGGKSPPRVQPNLSKNSKRACLTSMQFLHITGREPFRLNSDHLLMAYGRTIMMERKETGPIRPCHIREAYRRLKLEGKIPRRSVPRLFR